MSGSTVTDSHEPLHLGGSPERIAPAASPEMTAAIVAAVERFRRATASPAAPRQKDPDGWLATAILEGVLREHDWDVRDPWINT